MSDAASSTMEAGAKDVRPREWGRRLLAWFDKGVGKVPPPFQDAAQHHVYTVLSSRLFDTRGNKQNRLDWHWNNQIAEWSGDTPDEAHGISKLEVLAPLYMQWGSEDPRMMQLGTEFYEYIEMIPDYYQRQRFAFMWLRSSDVTVKRFADYLTRKQRYWAEKGIILESSDDLYEAAMGRRR